MQIHMHFNVVHLYSLQSKIPKEQSFKMKINLSTPWGRWHLGELFASTPWGSWQSTCGLAYHDTDVLYLSVRCRRM